MRIKSKIITALLLCEEDLDKIKTIFPSFNVRFLHDCIYVQNVLTLHRNKVDLHVNEGVDLYQFASKCDDIINDFENNLN